MSLQPRFPFPYDIFGIELRAITSAVRLANACREENIRLRADLMRAQAELERLKYSDNGLPLNHPVHSAIRNLKSAIER